MKNLRLFAAIWVMWLAVPVQAGLVPESELWEYWLPHNEQSTAVVDHEPWQMILDRYLQPSDPGANLFDYQSVTTADRQRLQSYLDGLAATDPRALNRPEQFAYWANMYNALTVAVVLDYYPVKSIRRIEGGLLGLGPWNEEFISVQGQALTLNDIEHRILRPIFQDPRIHYAVNCASIGCPDLMPDAFVAAKLNEQLDAAARGFINDARGVTFRKQRLQLSSIYDWYAGDFGAGEAGLIEHLSAYAEPDLQERLQNHTGRLRYDYDWRLNQP